MRTADRGRVWQIQQQPYGAIGLSDLVCPSVSDCEAVGSNSTSGLAAIENTVDGGATWTAQSAPPGVIDIGAIACASVAVCEAVGFDGSANEVAVGTTDGGTQWNTQTLPGALGPFYGPSIACPTTSTCVVVGDESRGSEVPEIFATTDGGATWTSRTVPANVVMLTGIACVSPATCEAVGALSVSDDAENEQPVSLASSDGGQTWTTQPVSTSLTGEPFSAITCPTENRCEALVNVTSEYPIYGTSDDGGTWTPQDVPGSPTLGLSVISCGSASTCMAMGDEGVVVLSQDGGNIWTGRGPTLAEEQAAQQKLGNAYVLARSLYAVSQVYPTPATELAVELRLQDPSFDFRTGDTSGTFGISVSVSPDGQVLVLADWSRNGRCWFVEDNEESSSNVPVPTDDTTALGPSYAATPSGMSYAHCNATAGHGGPDGADPKDISAPWSPGFPT
jgi:photosystem II stability/assembly factor-like uncharacterized protein